jgi:hypothetical protein
VGENCFELVLGKGLSNTTPELQYTKKELTNRTPSKLRTLTLLITLLRNKKRNHTLREHTFKPHI